MATLLRLREADRDERRVQLAEAQRAEEIVTNRLSRIDADLNGLIEQCQRDLRPGQIDIDRLMEAQRYELILRAERQAAGDQQRIVANEVERRREALVAADREVRVMQKLRERQLERHQEDHLREETKILDEVGIQGMWRKGH